MKSLVWGNKDYPVTQEYGVNLESIPDDWYAYAVDVGLPYGSHPGLDIGTPKYTNIYAIESGTVEQAGFAPYFRPNPVYVKTTSGETHIYGHLWENAVRQGQRVDRGTLLGKSGEQTYRETMTPDGSGPHLHFEARNEWGKTYDPSRLLTTGVSGDAAVEPSDTPSSGTGESVTTLPSTGTGSGLSSDFLASIFAFLGGASQRLGLAVAGIVLLGIGAIGLFGIDEVIPAAKGVKLARGVL